MFFLIIDDSIVVLLVIYSGGQNCKNTWDIEEVLVVFVALVIKIHMKL